MDEIRPYLFIVCGIISLIYVFKLKDSGDIKSCIVTGIVCLALGYFTWPESEEEESEYYPTMQSYYPSTSISFTGNKYDDGNYNRKQVEKYEEEVEYCLKEASRAYAKGDRRLGDEYMRKAETAKGKANDHRWRIKN
jgi:hypothetical protein